MKCTNTGTLQAFLDDELDKETRDEIIFHLKECKRCSSLLKEVEENNNFTFQKFEEYRKYSESTVYQQVTRPYKKKGALISMLNLKKIAAVACSISILTACITITPVRAAITNALSIFRMNDVKSLNITMEDINSIENSLRNHEKNIDMEKIGKIKTTGGETSQLTPDEAKGLGAVFPSYLTAKPSSINGVSPVSMEYTLNVGNINEAIKMFGGKKLLPQEMDRKTFYVDFQESININYTLDSNSKVSVYETKAPEIKVPEGTDADKLYEALSELPILPDNIRTQLKSIKDWKNNIYIPSIENVTEKVDINGSTGYINSIPANGAKTKAKSVSVIWSANGNIYVVQLNNQDKDELLKIARSMK
ncbi:MAG TPA: zf-HC2 domain-containing protein [Clostridia bacterium]